MPSRADRDALAQAALTNPAKAKRLEIWDYFFPIHPAQVGKAQLQEIEYLKQSKFKLRKTFDQQLEAAQKNAATTLTRAKKIALLDYRRAAMALGGSILLLTLAFVLKSWQINLLGALATLGGAGWFLFTRFRMQRHERALDHQVEAARQKLTAELQQANFGIDRQVRLLAQEIENLRRQIPTPPSGEQVWLYWQQDMQALTQRALERTGLASLVEELPESTQTFYVWGPAELQAVERIPKPFMTPEESDARKHLSTRQVVALANGQWIDLHGVYYLEVIILTPAVLANYGCFFDFITGDMITEQSSEQHYDDVVSLRISHEYREIKINRQVVPITDAATFGMTLSSGEKFQVTFPTPGYFSSMVPPSARTFELDKEHWLTNPEQAANRALAALRAELRKRRQAEDLPGVEA